MTRIGGFVDKIDSIGKGADKLMGPGGSITLLVTGIGAAFGGLKGAITANLIKNGVDPFTALIVGNITSVIPGALAEVFTKAIVTKAIATFGASVAAASAGGAVASGVAGAVTAGAATAGVAATAIAALPAILAAAGVVAAIGGMMLVLKELEKPVIDLTTKPGFDAPNIFDILFQPGGIFGRKKLFGNMTDSPMDAKYGTPNIVVKIGEKKLDVIITDALGRVLADGPR
jgi:hypothetical protein